MRKTALFLVICLVATLLAGCAGTPVIYYTECTCPAESHQGTTVVTPAAPQAPAAEGALKTGLAVVAGIGDS